MRYLTLPFSLIISFGLAACTFEVQMLQPRVTTETPISPSVTGTDIHANGQAINGPEIDFNGIRFTLDPVLGSQVFVFDDVINIDGATAHSTRFALAQEEYCQTWCLIVYPVADFKQAFGSFVFPPAGYRGGAAVIFEAQKEALSFQNGRGERGLEAFGQDLYGISNESLKYVFRGYTSDQQFAVFVQVPIRAKNLPDAAPTMTTNFQDISSHNQQAAQSMAALTPTDFTPNLGLLDDLAGSIGVGMP